MNSSVSFDPVKHEYDGGRLPSVTQILDEVGLLRKDFYTIEGRERGRAVHLACQFYDEGDLDLESVDGEINGYLAAYIKWRKETGTKPDWIEIPIGGHHKNFAYAGTPDRIMTTRPRSLVDLKTGAFQEWHRIQTALYVNLLEDPWSYSRFGLYLKATGDYSIREFPKSEYAADLNVGLSALNIVTWKRSN
jgi:hypothetical protein